MALTREQALVELTRPGAPFEVATAEVEGVPVRAFARAPSSLRAILESSGAHGHRDFLVYGDDRFTFAEHLRVVGGLARWLAAEHSVGKGDRVAIGMRNYPEWVMTFWATQVLGAVAVPLNAWWTAQELRYALDDSGTTVAVLDGERYERLGADQGDLALPAVVVRHDGELTGGAVHWADVRSRLDREAGLPEVEIAPGDTATIIYTSGTTGAPKGAMGTHRNHVTNYLDTALGGALAAMTAPPQDGVADAGAAPPPCSLQTYPYFHIGGITGLYTSTGFGVKVVLLYKWDLEEALRLIERERVTSFAAVPAILREMFDSPLLEKYDVSSLGTVASGGAPVPPDLVDRVDRKFGSRAAPSNGYGLTETTSAVTLNRGRDYLQRPTSVGRTLPVVDVRVVDPETGRDRSIGEVGEPSGPRRGPRSPRMTCASMSGRGWRTSRCPSTSCSDPSRCRGPRPARCSSATCATS